MVAGQPERVQSPARNRFGIAVRLTGRRDSRPGAAEKFVALNFLHDMHAFSELGG